MIMLMTAGFLGLALSSCSKGDSEPEYQKPVEFSGYTARSVTKAGASFVTGAELPKDQPFGVYAYNTGTSETFDPTPATIATYGKFMTNVPVTYNGNGAGVPTNYTYVYRYWPNDEVNNKLAFFAYYPHGGAGISQTSDQAGFGDFNFTVQSLPENQVDFMISDVVPGKVYSNTNPTGVVPLSFYHMLTQVKFKGITDAPSGVKVKITSIKVVHVINKGTLAPSYPSVTSSVWTPDNSSFGTYTLTPQDIELPSTTVNASAEAVDLTDASQALLMVPQTIDDDSYLEIVYTITTTNPERTITQTQTLTLNEALDTWTRNQQIVYTFNIGLHPIEFSAKVGNWIDDEYIIIVE